MTIIDYDNTVYENAIEMYFHEYFENRGISIDGTGYKAIDNSLFEAAFRYVYKKLFKPDKTTVRYNNKNTKIDLKDIDELNIIADAYIDIIKDYAIIPYDKFFLELTGIHKDTFNSWSRCEYSHGGLSILYSDLVKKIQCLPKEQTINRMTGTPVNLLALANNEPEFRMEYNSKRQLEEVTARQLSGADIRAMLTEKASQSGPKNVETQDMVDTDG